MDMVFQKCVELGVSDFYPLYSQHTSVNIKQERISQKLAHWSGVITSACEQSGRTILPQLHPPMDFAQAITQVAFDGVKIILDPLADFKLSEVSLEQPAKLALYIGPEGGFSADELVFAKANGCIACGLGPRILRTETAAITGVSILQAKWGDL